MTGKKIVEKSLENQLNILLDLNSTILNTFLISDWKEKFIHRLHHSDMTKKFIEKMESKLRCGYQRQVSIFDLLRDQKDIEEGVYDNIKE